MAWLDSWALVFMICGRPLFTLLITIPWCHLSPGAGESAPSPVTHLLPVSLAPPPHWWMTGSSRRQTVCALFLTHTGMFWAFTLSVFNHKQSGFSPKFKSWSQEVYTYSRQLVQTLCFPRQAARFLVPDWSVGCVSVLYLDPLQSTLAWFKTGPEQV